MTAQEIAQQRELARRRRVIYIPEDYVLGVFAGVRELSSNLRLPQSLDLPKTARVVGVWTDFLRNAFAFVVEDMSFDPVPEGSQLPEMQVFWTCVEIQPLKP